MYGFLDIPRINCLDYVKKRKKGVAITSWGKKIKKENLEGRSLKGGERVDKTK